MLVGHRRQAFVMFWSHGTESSFLTASHSVPFSEGTSSGEQKEVGLVLLRES